MIALAGQIKTSVVKVDLNNQHMISLLFYRLYRIRMNGRPNMQRRKERETRGCGRACQKSDATVSYQMLIPIHSHST